jgi:hypothetical protein
MNIDFKHTRDLLYDFQFNELFVEELGWNQPTTHKATTLEIEEKTYNYRAMPKFSI